MHTLFAPALLSVAVLFSFQGAHAQSGNPSPENPFPVHPDVIPDVRGWNEKYTSLEEYEKAATNGESEAQFYLGNIYLKGEGVPQDMARAVKWLKKAANAGEPHAEYTLGVLHMEGKGLPRDFDESRRWLNLAATWNLPEAKQALVKLDAVQQKDVTDDLLSKAKAGNPTSQYQFAKRLLGSKSATDADQRTAREWLERAANGNHPESAYELGLAYRDGVGGERDESKARYWLGHASEVGVLRARIALAELERGQEPLAPSSLAAAAQGPLLAARRGDAQAQYDVAMMFLSGDRVARDTTAAKEWLIKAANQNHRLAQRTLAEALARGIDFEQDYDEAAKWYLRAAQAGDSDAQFAMGTLYSVGLGVKANTMESQRWYSAAAKQGNRKARERLSDTPY